MTMADIITLSSSPPPMFARSPTPVTVSSLSPRKNLDSIRAPHHTTPQQFRSAQTSRDGFSPAFTTARQILGAKSSAENVPLALSKSLQPKQTRFLGDELHNSNTDNTSQELAVLNDHLGHNERPTIIKILPSDVRRTKKVRSNGPLNLEKALTRRKDWTPPKPATPQNVTTDIPGFSIDLGRSFGHTSHSTNNEVAYSVEDSTHSKRRKLDPAAVRVMTPPTAQIALTKSGKSSSKLRNKSPTKKPITITGLTTSHYSEVDHEQQNSTLMMQFLASTQARMQSDDASDMFETSLNKKSAKSKKSKSKSRLVSPRTSMKTIGEQDFVFASASQLARDESPTLLRDTAEAIKQSEECSFTDDGLTQQTAPISIGSVSPEAGVARYRSRRSLWCAAHRDENDALLYRNDPFDQSSFRTALAGKDVLVDNDSATRDAGDRAEDSFSLLATLQKDPTVICDIDDLTTPIHTTSKPSVPIEKKKPSSVSSQTPSKRTKADTASRRNSQQENEDTAIQPPKPKIPSKPNYASWTDEQLKDQVNEYGFKRLRARKTMIDKLDEYWAQKYGIDIAIVKAATKAASKNIIDRDHGHFLSKVHELAPRPQPKTGKPRTKRVNDGPFASVSKRKTKSKLVETSGVSQLDHEGIFDIDEIDNKTALDRLAAIKPFPDEVVDILEPSTAPVRGTGVKAATKSKAKRKAKPADRLLTPPPTLPEDPIIDSSPGFTSPHSKASALVSTAVNLKTEDADISLKSHIRVALLHPIPSPKRRNHQKDPSWHEKILLYDPVILEDFTAWLNTEGFNAIGIDDEIDAKEVKVWCEENGICCLWKGGWRGNKVKE